MADKHKRLPDHQYLLAAIVALSPVVASAQEGTDPMIDARAVEIVTRATDYLSDQPRVRFNWFNSFDVVVDGREKITHFRSGVAMLSRNEGFYGSSELDGVEREFFYDGGTFVVHDINANAYSELPFAGTFEELAERLVAEYDVVLPMVEVLSRQGNDGLLDDMEAAAYLGEIKIAGVPVHHLAFSEYDQHWQIWISTDEERPVIQAIVGSLPYVQGWPQYRAYFSDWDFESFPEDGAFTFQPSEDAIRMTMPKTGLSPEFDSDAPENGG